MIVTIIHISVQLTRGEMHTNFGRGQARFRGHVLKPHMKCKRSRIKH